MSLIRCVAWVALLAAQVAGAQPLGTAISYQGQLKESGQPASGLYDMQGCLYGLPVGDPPLACTVEFDDVPVEDGVFTLALDFGSQPYTGEQRFLELRVRAGSDPGDYEILSPRQPLRAVPEALRAEVASAAPWSGLVGLPAGFADGIDSDSGGTVTAIAAGAGLSGGTITTDGVIGIADGGVGPAQLAPNAVGAAQLAPGSVGFAQIDASQVQARVSGTCGLGAYVRGISTDGGVLCADVPGLTAVTIVDDPANRVGEATSIAIGADGLPVIAYRDVTALALKVAKCANAACIGAATVNTVDDPPNDVGRYPSIAIGADGLPVISYYDNTAETLKVARCANADCTGAATITTVHDAANDVGAYGAIAIGADGLPVISHYDVTASTLQVAKCNDAACAGPATITTVDDPANAVGAWTSIAVGVDGLPVISYRDLSAGALKVAQCSNSACTGTATTTTVDDPANIVGADSDIAIGADGTPVVSYWDQTAAALKVAKCVDAACNGPATITTVDDRDNSVGYYTSIAVGTDGNPIVSYWDATAGALMVARCANPACTGTATITTVDNPPTSVGLFTAIAIGADGLPVVSYFDTSAGLLKVARCGSRSCR